MKEIDEIIKNKKYLLKILEEVQKKYGFLPKNVIKHISKKTKIPLTKIFGMASFYMLFNVEKRGKFAIRVCNSPSCHINGSLDILEFIKDKLKINVGETTPDKKYSLSLVHCVGCCDKAPAMMLNDRVYGKLTKEKIKKILKLK